MQGAVAASSPARAVRCAAVAAVTVLTASGGHLLGGGHVPGPASLGAFVLPVTALVAVLGRTRWTPVRLLGLLALAQGAFHLAFTQMTDAPGAGLRMLAWHVVATAAGTALVLHGERWLWRALGVLLPPLPLLAPGAPVTAVPGTPPDADSAGLPRWLLATLERTRRGPPARATV